MIIETKELKEKLKVLKPSFDLKDINGWGQYIYISNELIMGYNGKIRIVSVLDQVDFFECVIKTKIFSDFIQKTTVKELKFIKENGNIIITGKNVKLKVTENKKMLKELRSFIPAAIEDWKSLPTNFLEGLKMCIYAASVRGPYSKLLIANDIIYSTDSYRFSKFNLTDSIDQRIFISVAACTQILKYKFDNYLIKNDCLYLLNSDIIFSCGLIDENYADIEKVMNSIINQEGVELVLPDELIEQIDISAIMVDPFLAELHQTIDVNISDGRITLSGTCSKGKIEINVDYENNKHNIKFSIHPLFFKDVLNMTTNIKLLKDIAVFSTNNFTHLFSLGV